jgi:hypothetical protein
MNAASESARREEMERRIREYHGVSMAEVLELIDYLRSEGDAVLVGGSLALGLGNRESDLDIVLVGGSESSRVPVEHWTGSLRVDVWRRTQSDIDVLFERAERALAAPGPLAGAFGHVEEEADFKLLHRVAFGVVVDGPRPVPSGTRDHAQVARDLVAREYAERMREAGFLAGVALELGRPLAATTSARLAVEAALHTTLVLRGYPFTGEKWLQERLANDAPELQRTFAAFAVLPDPDEDARPFVGSAVEACRELTGLDLSVAALAPAAVWENARADLRMMKVGARHLLVSKRHGALWQPEGEELEAWEALERRGATWGFADCDETQNALAFQLFAAGLVGLGWTHGVPSGELAVTTEAAA